MPKYHIGQRVVDFEGEHGVIQSIEMSPPIKPYLVRLDSGKEYRYYEDSIRPETRGQTINEVALISGYEPPAAPPQVNNRAIVFEVVVYENGTSAIDYYWRLGDNNRVYAGRAYNDEQETDELLNHKLFRRHWEESKSVEPPTLRGD